MYKDTAINHMKEKYDMVRDWGTVKYGAIFKKHARERKIIAPLRNHAKL